MRWFSFIFAFDGGGSAGVEPATDWRRMMTRQRAVALSCAVLGAVIATVVVSRRQQRPQDPFALLASAMPAARSLDVRVTGGLPWRPLAPAVRGSLRARTEQAGFQAVAMNVARELDGVSGSEAAHLRGIANLLGGQTDVSLESLGSAVQDHGKNARAWTDLGSAWYVEADEEERPVDLPLALAAMDRALELNATLPEALFNRAVILERMGLRSHAASAWRDYLAIDPQSEWAGEARRRLAESSRETARVRFRAAAPAMEAAAMRGDDASLRASVAAFRQLSRAWCEVEVLGRWADAAAAGNDAEAAAQLTFARAVGGILESISQETLLRDAVAVTASAQGTSRQALIEGHQLYRQARRTFEGLRPADAEALFRRAATLLASGNSPVADVARFYMAAAIYDQQRVDEARGLLLELAERMPPGRRALDAEVSWELGLTSSVQARWSEAFTAYQHSLESLEALGENGYLGYVHGLLATAYEGIGDRDEAWRERLVAFALMSDDGGTRLRISLESAARAEVQAGRFAPAASLLRLVLAEQASSNETRALAYATRAEVKARLGDRSAAARDLADAAAAAAKIVDAATRAHIEALLQASAAAVVVDAEPGRALKLLAGAERQYAHASRRFLLPNVYLQRGRALRALGRDDDALAAITAGITELEAQRAGVIAHEARWGVLDAGEGLFAEAIDLSTRRSDFSSAFASAERWRARTLRDSLGLRRDTPLPPSGLGTVQKILPADALLLEYAVLDDRLLVFAVTRDRFETFVHRVSRADLRRVTASFTSAVRERRPIAEVQERAAEAYMLLIAPAASMLGSARVLVIVPDRFLQLVPYAALFDAEKQQYLLQRYEVAVTPAAHVLPLVMGAKRAAPERDAFVVGEPDTRGDFERLPGAEQEARNTAALYGGATVGGRAATRELFTDSWGDAAVVHFAGHASSEGSRGAAAALAFSGRDGAELLHAHEIARMRPAATSLVVLAACDTFAGTKEHLEGTQTLAHAFLSAGVPTVVGTLWSIEDAPAHDLFSTFHRNYVAGLPAVTALRRAQLDQLADQDERARHPASWAGVEVVGHPWQTFIRKRRAP
jgi:CHAT domain-containing protein/TolA-binding protein